MQKSASPKPLEHYSKIDALSETLPKTQSNSEAPAPDFFEALAKLIPSYNKAPSLEPVSREETLPLSFAQERLWLLHQLSPENPCYHQPIAFHHWEQQLSGDI